MSCVHWLQLVLLASWKLLKIHMRGWSGGLAAVHQNWQRIDYITGALSPLCGASNVKTCRKLDVQAADRITPPFAQETIITEKDLQPQKPLWHEDTRGPRRNHPQNLVLSDAAQRMVHFNMHVRPHCIFCSAQHFLFCTAQGTTQAVSQNAESCRPYIPVLCSVTRRTMYISVLSHAKRGPASYRP